MGDQYDPQPIVALTEALRQLTAQNAGVLDEYKHTVQALGHTITSMAARTGAGRGTGPKAKEPGSYDGDRTAGKLDDHIRDLENWVRFHESRGHWIDETEKVSQAATYLTGKMH